MCANERKRLMHIRSKYLLPLLMIAAGTLAGCSWILLGAGAGAAGAAYSMGALRATKDVSLRAAYDAGLRAVEELRLEVQEKRADELTATIQAQTADRK